MAGSTEEKDQLLFETKPAKRSVLHKLFCAIIAVGILLIWAYRLLHFPGSGERGRWAWFGLSFAEVSFGLYWVLTQASRWRVVYRYPFKDRLSTKHKDKFPRVDVFVCTADPTLEPPSLVINTVLSVMSYEYPAHKLGIYLSDDGCSELTFYALLEASEFSKHWIPFCKRHAVEPRAPEVYFAGANDLSEPGFVREWTDIKNMYVDMKTRIELAGEKGRLPDEIRGEHKGFSEWDSGITKNDHHSIVQILIDGSNPEAVDVEGRKLPMLVYLSREKKPGWVHNFKAGSMNALIRVSSEISNAPIILNLDCDMYSNDPDAIKDAMCFFLDKNQGPQISYVQHPQRFCNTTKNDLYGNAGNAIFQIELAGIDGLGAPLYIGTGCFHRRESLSGKHYKNRALEWNNDEDNTKGRTVKELEVNAKPLADCSYEKGTSWGKGMGLVYGFSVEDVVTGLTIQCRGWKPVYYIPSKNAFQGIGPTNLDIALVQFKRWCEGMFQIFCSKYCPFIYGHGRINLGAQMGYSVYLLWAPVSLPTLCYSVIPAVTLIHRVPLFPEVSTLWFIPFACVFISTTAYSLAEEVMSGGTVKGWWNLQRMWLYRRVSSYLFALIDTVYKWLGLSETSFELTDKVMDAELKKRYDQEIIEFGSQSIMFVMIGMLALVNLFGLGYGLRRMQFSGLGQFVGQMSICGVIVALNLPVYEALFVRRDNGRIPFSVVFKSLVIASGVCFISV